MTPIIFALAIVVAFHVCLSYLEFQVRKDTKERLARYDRATATMTERLRDLGTRGG